MKKAFLIIILCIGYSGLFAQKSSVTLDLGYRINAEKIPKVGIGGQFKYRIVNGLRLGADITAYIPDDSNLGFDAGITAQYLIDMTDRFSVYPIVGAIMSNHSFSADPITRNQTEFGFSAGLGAEYNIGRKNFINLDFKYSFIDKEKPAWYDDYGIIRIGYGFRF